MSSKLKDKFSLDEIARGFELIRTKGENGQVAFGGFKFTDLETVLLTSIEWDESLSDYERERINFKIPFKAGEFGKITKATLLKALHELESERFSAKLANYIVVFTLSLRYSSFLRSVKVGDVEIKFHSKLPDKFDRKPIRHPLYLGEIKDLPERYVVVCAEVSAKSVYDAYTRAQTALDIMRGIWNYVINRRTGMITRIGGGASEQKPINKILLGPVHTVHLPDGSLATNEWWHNSSFEMRDSEDLGSDWKILLKSGIWCLHHYHAMPYVKEATNMWLRYAYALDHADREITFLKLWSLLESITGTVGGPYNETISRTLFVLHQREFHRMILEHLRDRRNALVHHDDGSSKVEQHVYQLKGYVEELLRLHLVLGKRFKNINEFGEFLSLPADLEILKTRRLLYGQAIRFREGTER